MPLILDHAMKFSWGHSRKLRLIVNVAESPLTSVPKYSCRDLAFWKRLFCCVPFEMEYLEKNITTPLVVVLIHRDTWGTHASSLAMMWHKSQPSLLQRVKQWNGDTCLLHSKETQNRRFRKARSWQLYSGTDVDFLPHQNQTQLSTVTLRKFRCVIQYECH